VTWVWRWWRR